MSGTDLKERESGVEDFSGNIDNKFPQDEIERLRQIHKDDQAEAKKAETENPIVKENNAEPDNVGRQIPYRQEKKRLFRGKGVSKRRKKLFIALGGTGGFALLLLIIFLAFLAGTLKIHNLKEHLLEYNMVSVSRSFADATQDNMVEKFVVDGDEAALKSELDSQFGGSWTGFLGDAWSKLDNFRPEKLIQNMQEDGRLQFVYTEQPRTIFPGTKLELSAIRVNGEDIPVADLNAGHYFSNLAERQRFGAQLEVGLEEALPDVPNMIRNRVADSIRSDLGIELKWWEKLGSEYAGLKEDAALKKQEQESYDKIASDATNDCATPEICAAAQDAKKELDKEVKDGTAPETDLATIKNESESIVSEAAAENSSTVRKVIQDAVASSSVASSALSTFNRLNPIYQIALPVCIIYDASITKSGGTIDSKSAADQRAFYAVESAADQQTVGDTTSEAVGAMNDKLGNISTSIPEQRSYNRSVNTLSYISPTDMPQNGGLGEITNIVDVLPGPPAVKDFANAILSHCPEILSWKTALGVALAQIIAALVSGGASVGAEGATEAAAGEATGLVTEDVVGGVAADEAASVGASALTDAVNEQVSSTPIRSFTDRAKDMLTKMGRDTILLGGLSLMAKLLVLAKMGGNTTGLESNGSFANRADVGANLHANELHRQALMGRPETPSEQFASREADQQYIAANIKKESFSQRYLAVDNADSLAAKVGFGALAIWNDISASHSLFFTKLLNFGSLFSAKSLFSSILLGNHRVEAAQFNQTGNYGIVQWGWSNDELNLIASNSTYKPVMNSEIYARDPQKSAIESRYANCFTDTMGKLLSSGDIVKHSDGSITGKCSPDELGPYNTKGFGDGVFRYRLSKRNDFILDHLNDIQNPSAGGLTAPASGG